MAAFLARCLDSTRSARSLADEVRIVLTRNKLGRRAVHHILTASERKAFEIAKRNAHLVRSAGARKQPLADTYYKYCQALQWPYIFIHRDSIGGDNLVVVDLRTLGLSEGRLEQLVTLVVATLGPLNDECWHQTLQTTSEIFVGLPTKEPDDKPLESGNEDQVIPSLRGMLRFQGTFGETKNMCRASLDICHSFLVDNGIELTKPWWTVD
ncbi:hypothetical protein SELMODRAFT_407195 [Selaginella moellendorffii]|uniref:Uncharacterized protein n=1 Tax=Selaginella moellendorffii TaxID=88036 RepID=D8R480_SELML|nr:uncharacterized protein LOC9634921 isoform X2 [Selaginella moellendorffii]EFJ33417.1 hypothetical protein SELMODRAFT_407195 [Selaginella moellendorffii]|eukprot:XP_002965997.1 uncharacterized protein LOC9634921 isoform X2 [Selaginella moellendorffii]